MPHRFDISKINEIDEEENPYPDKSDFNDWVEGDYPPEEDDFFYNKGEKDYYYSTHICYWCNALDNYCSFCGGSGVAKKGNINE